MTVEELVRALHHEGISKDELYVCHYARRAGKNIPIVRPLAGVEWIDGQLCLVEKDDRGLYNADR